MSKQIETNWATKEITYPCNITLAEGKISFDDNTYEAKEFDLTAPSRWVLLLLILPFMTFLSCFFPFEQYRFNLLYIVIHDTSHGLLFCSPIMITSYFILFIVIKEIMTVRLSGKEMRLSLPFLNLRMRRFFVNALTDHSVTPMTKKGYVIKKNSGQEPVGEYRIASRHYWYLIYLGLHLGYLPIVALTYKHFPHYHYITSLIALSCYFFSVMAAHIFIFIILFFHRRYNKRHLFLDGPSLKLVRIFVYFHVAIYLIAIPFYIVLYVNDPTNLVGFI